MSKVNKHFEQHIEIMKDIANKTVSPTRGHEILTGLDLTINFSIGEMMSWIKDNIKKKKRKHIRHDWDSNKNLVHRYLVRYGGNIKASAEDVYPNSKHAYQSLRTWINKNFGSADKFIVQHERKMKDPQALNNKQLQFYIKMLETAIGKETAADFKKLASMK